MKWRKIKWTDQLSIIGQSSQYHLHKTFQVLYKVNVNYLMQYTFVYIAFLFNPKTTTTVNIINSLFITGSENACACVDICGVETTQVVKSLHVWECEVMT